MIRHLLRKVITAKRYKGTLGEKFSVFKTLLALDRKAQTTQKDNKIVSCTIFEYRMFAYSYPSLNYLFKEIFVDNQYYFDCPSAEPVIIDCGANIGMAVLYFKRLFPLAKIMAFEPNPSVFKLLEKNIAVNGLKDVDTHNVALYDAETEVSFFTGDDLGSFVSSVIAERGGNRETKVKAQRLSHYLKNISYVDLIKMDVEGAEVNIVNDLHESGMLSKSRQYIVEYHHNLTDSRSTLPLFLQKFEAFGFKYNLSSGFNRQGDFQDILIYFYKD